jgi:CDP-glucose 4,6-dehydratase
MFGLRGGSERRRGGGKVLFAKLAALYASVGATPQERWEHVNTSFWKDRPVFVSGATGLIGSWLVKRLVEAGAMPVCLVRDSVPISELARSGLIDRVIRVRGDIGDRALIERTLSEYEIPTVIHLAAQTLVGTANRNPVATFEINIRGTWVLLDACRRVGGVQQVIISSSDQAYGAQEQLPFTEASPLQGRHPYGVSKSCADLLAQTYAETYGLPVGITRCGNFYGGGDLNWSRIVPGTIRSLTQGERPVIRSDGRFIRDYLYVEDGVEAYLRLAEALAEQPELRGQAFNFANEHQIDVLGLVERIRTLMGSELEPLVRNEASNEIREQYLDATRARDILGWNAGYSLDEGLLKTIDWYREHFALQ